MCNVECVIFNFSFHISHLSSHISHLTSHIISNLLLNINAISRLILESVA